MAPHPLGQASLAIDPAKSVFINCPFDTDFAGKFEAIVFTIVCCGFTPRCAHEGVQAEGRVTRILQPLFSSHYSIHDLSRCKGEGDENYARFNMPLELGMAMARRYQIEQTNSTAKKKVQTYFPHEWLVLVPQGHNSRRYISDLGAFDLKEHDGNKETIVVRVLSWLRFTTGHFAKSF